jgi:serine/threonine protein kinase
MLFFTMPFIEGGSLRARLKAEGRLPIKDALVIARDAADALGHAHMNGIIHRDVKPDNLLLSPAGAVLLDFGIARAPSLARPDMVVDKPGYVMGTADYTSPERVSGKRAEDARSDLFSLGCVLYEMLTGRTPFPGGVRQLMKEAGAELTFDATKLPESLPDAVIGVLRRSLAAYPSDRFATARAMSAALSASIEKLADAA